jgi:hypothetical protein
MSASQLREIKAELTFPAIQDGTLHAFACWFDVFFDGPGPISVLGCILTRKYTLSFSYTHPPTHPSLSFASLS